jgi:hypothetical protein
MGTIGNRALERNSFCASCGASFTPWRSSARFCSTRCRTAAHRSSTAACNATTARRKARSAIKSTPGIVATPRLSVTRSCGASFTPLRSSARFCSTRCRTAAHRSSTAVCNATTARKKARSAIKSTPGIVATPRLSVTRNPRIVVDERWSGVYRLRLPDGSLSDMVNLARARDALASLERGQP